MAQNFLTGINIVGDALSISGNSVISSARHAAFVNLTTTGDNTLGNATSDSTTINGKLITNGAILGGSDGANGGIRIHSGGTKFFSVNSSNAATNGVMDVGASDAKFKDLYLSGEVDAATLDISGDADIDGTTNLDAVDIDGAVQLDGTLTVGVNDTGYDVKLFGATSGRYLLWDESGDKLLFTDDAKMYFGTNEDLLIYHSNGDSANYIINNIGDLYLRNEANDKDIIFQSDDGSGGYETYFYLDGSGTRTIFEKLTRHVDDVYAAFGSDSDLRIYHDASNSYIKQTTGGTGDLIIEQDVADKDIILKSDDGSGGTTAYITLDGSGTTTLFSKDTVHQTNVKAYFGSSSNMSIWHDGNNGSIQNDTGHIYIRNTANDSDIYFLSDNGAGNHTEYFWLDGGEATHDGSATTALYTIFPDKSHITLGTGKDLDMYHDGSNSYIYNNTGDLFIDQSASDGDIVFKGTDDSSDITALTLDMSDAGTAKFNHDVNLVDDAYVQLGTSQELQIYHTGSGNSIISHSTGAGGDMYIDAGGTLYIRNSTAGGESMIKAIGDGAVELYHNNVKKIETTSAGVTVTGSITSTSDITATGADFTLQHAAGSTIYLRREDADNAIVDGNCLGLLNFQGDDPTNDSFNTGASIGAYAAGDWASSSYESELIFKTTTTGGTLTTALTLDEAQNATFAGTLTIPSYIYHASDTDTYFGFSAANTYKVHTGGSDRFSVAGDVHVLGTTDFAIPAGRKFYLDGQSNTYITESSADTIKIFTGGTEALEINSSQNATFAGSITTTFITSSTGGQFNGGVTVGADDTGHDVRFYGATAGHYMLWDESEDRLAIVGEIYITGDGSNDVVLSESGTGNFTINAPGDINLDADGGDINLKDDTTFWGQLRQDSSHFIMEAKIADKDIVFKGTDGSTETDALRLDMSEGGNASFSGRIADLHKKYCSASISNSYVRIYFADDSTSSAGGSQMGTIVRLTGTSHGTSHVGCFTALINVSHYQSAHIESFNNFYGAHTSGASNPILKVESDNNGSYTLSMKTASTNAATYYFTIECLTPESTITTLPGSTASTSTTHEHTMIQGSHSTGAGGYKGVKITGDLHIKQLDDAGFDEGFIIERSANTQKLIIGMDGGAVNFNSPDGLSYKFRNNGSEKFTIDSSGNITPQSRITFDYGGDHYMETGTDTLSFKASSGTVQSTFNFSDLSTTFAGTVTATSFHGSGAALTGVTSEWDGTLTGNATITGNLTVTKAADVSVNLISTATDGNVKIDITPTGGGDAYIRTAMDANTSLVFTKATDDEVSVLTLDNDSNATFAGDVVTAGDIMAANGTVTNPSITFNSDTDLGIYRNTTNQMTLVAAGEAVGLIHSGGIQMHNNDIDYVNQLHFQDNVRFYDDGNDSYLNFKFGDTSFGGIKMLDGSNNVHGYFYADGDDSIGILDSGGSWAVQVDNDVITALKVADTYRVKATTTGVELTGAVKNIGGFKIHEPAGDELRAYFNPGASATADPEFTIYRHDGVSASVRFRPGTDNYFENNIGIGHTTPQFGLTLAQGSSDATKIGWEDSSNNKRASILCNSGNDNLEFRTGTSENIGLHITASQTSYFHNSVYLSSSGVGVLSWTGSAGNSVGNAIVMGGESGYGISFRGGGSERATMSSTGDWTFAGTITATTNGSSFGNISVDRINLADNEKIIWGGGSDLQIYHQSSDDTSYIFANNTNALKIATETSGTPITIGHTTSQTTIGDNLTVTGDLTSNKGTFSAAGDGNAAILHVTDTADTEVAWFEGNRAGDTGAYIAIRHNPSTPQESNRSGIKFQCDDDGGNVTNYASIVQYIDDHTNTTEDGRLDFSVIKNATMTETLRLDANGVTTLEDVTFAGANYNLMWDKSANRLEFWDNAKLSFGDPGGTPDLELYHDGSHSYIKDQGTGHLQILSSQLQINSADNSENMATFAENGAVNLYNNGVVKFGTTSAGATVTGALTTTGDLNVGTSSNTVITIGDHSANAQGRLRFLTSDNSKNFQIGFNYNVAGGLEITRSTAAGGETFTTPDVVVASSGNVGIGITSPTTHYDKVLHLHEASGQVAIHITNNTTGSTNNDGSDIIAYEDDLYILNREHTAGRIFIGVTNDGSQTLEMDHNKYSTFAGKIKVNGTPVANVGVAEFHDSSTDTYTTTAFNNYPTTTLYGINTADTYVGTRFTHAGNTEMFVGVVKGSNNGELKYVFQGYNGSAYQEFGYIDCYSTGAGSLVMSGDVVAYSDKKLKKNIKTLDGSKVYDMRGVSFTRKDTEKEGSGVIAQEMQEVAPELVNESSDGTLGVSYGNITGYLIEAIKDLKAEIEELKKCNKCENCNCENK